MSLASQRNRKRVDWNPRMLGIRFNTFGMLQPRATSDPVMQRIGPSVKPLFVCLGMRGAKGVPHRPRLSGWKAGVIVFPWARGWAQSLESLEPG